MVYNMEPLIQLTCFSCGKSFSKDPKEFRRRKKLGQTNFFCSRRCSITVTHTLSPRLGNIKNLRAGNRRDIFTQFRWFVLRAQGRPQHECNLDVAYLQELWMLQAGKCPITGWDLLLPDNTDGWKNGRSMWNASIDRIDNSLGYVKGNVRFTSIIANLARGQFTDDELRLFCNAVVSNTITPDKALRETERHEV